MMQVFAPAKINLSLRILGRRNDGFHEIETLIAPISLCDQIEIDKTDCEKGIEFSCDDLSLPTGDEFFSLPHSVRDVANWSRL